MTFVLIKLIRLVVLFQTIFVVGRRLDPSDHDTIPNRVAKRFLHRIDDELNRERGSQKIPAEPYELPGPFQPIPGRTATGDYWPTFPFASQYHAGFDFDPARGRLFTGDLTIPMLKWGLLDIVGRAWYRVPDTTTKLGFVNQPINTLELNEEQFYRLATDSIANANRGYLWRIEKVNNIFFQELQPKLPIAMLPKAYVPVSCRPPMCNPYTHTFAFGFEQDPGTTDGFEGDIDVAIPISKGIAYRYPLSGNLFFDIDNITVTYGETMGAIDPLFTINRQQWLQNHFGGATNLPTRTIDE